MARGLQDFKADIKANPALAAKFKGLKSAEEIVSKARSEGYVFSAQDLEKAGGISGKRDVSAAGFFVNF